MFVLSPFRKSVGKYTLPKPQQMNPLNVDQENMYVKCIPP